MGWDRSAWPLGWSIKNFESRSFVGQAASNSNNLKVQIWVCDLSETKIDSFAAMRYD